ncbi:MAG TPA: hypothetical protein DCR46_00035, partial [Cytophagales bacterium]|nr:hypothetical protein [Cytophagales bacterium]
MDLYSKNITMNKLIIYCTILSVLVLIGCKEGDLPSPSSSKSDKSFSSNTKPSQSFSQPATTNYSHSTNPESEGGAGSGSDDDDDDDFGGDDDDNTSGGGTTSGLSINGSSIGSSVVYCYVDEYESVEFELAYGSKLYYFSIDSDLSSGGTFGCNSSTAELDYDESSGSNLLDEGEAIQGSVSITRSSSSISITFKNVMLGECGNSAQKTLA